MLLCEFDGPNSEGVFVEVGRGRIPANTISRQVTVLPVNVYVPIVKNDATLTTVTLKGRPQEAQNRCIPQSLTQL
ncbi:MAG: hypothetical protein ACI9G1_001798 [Pirellulaceae bacterium]|jgi:hypothetical protein